MKKKLVWLLSALVLLSAAGCSTKDSNKVKVDDGEVTLGQYKGLSADKNVYRVSDEEIEDEIKVELSDYMETKEVKRASKNGDILTITIKGMEKDTLLVEYTDETVDIILGEEEFGPEVDKKLTGVKAGQKLSFRIAYPEDYEVEEWADRTVEWTIAVKEIVEEVYPELTDAFVKENLGYNSYDEMKTKVKESLEKEDETRSKYELQENLIDQVVKASTVDSSSEELKKKSAKAIEDNYKEYAEIYGFESVEEFYKEAGIGEEDLKKLEDNLVARTLVVRAVAKKEKISLTDEDYKAGMERMTSELGFENTDELVEYYGESSLKDWLLEERVVEVLQKDATITEKEAQR